MEIIIRRIINLIVMFILGVCWVITLIPIIVISYILSGDGFIYLEKISDFLNKISRKITKEK